MARFTIPATRFPWSPVQIRTRLGLVEFHDHVADVDDANLADALRDVPEVFGIREEASPTGKRGKQAEKPSGQSSGEGPARPPGNASRAVWADYAAAIGVDAAAIAAAERRGDVIALVDEHERQDDSEDEDDGDGQGGDGRG